MFEWRKSRENGLPDEARSPESGYRMAAEGIQFRWRWDSGTISTQLDVIWGMSVKIAEPLVQTGIFCDHPGHRDDARP